MNRLNSNIVTIQYDAKGNVTSKSNVGTFSYDNVQKPYAVTGASAVGSSISANTQDITFYSFRRPRHIAEGLFTVDFAYDGNLDRVKEEVKQNDTILETRYSLGGCYDYIVGTSVNQTEEDLYLAGGYYDAPMLMQRYGDGSSYISHLVRDYQGSIVSIVDSTGFWHNDYSYDAWGRPRNPQTHTVYNPSALNTYSSAYRGYCGHEHLPQFGLINMNARLYDPDLSRFLSPDPYVQMPDNTQSFNRYSYCLNNPMKYTDPSGELFIIDDWIIGAIKGLFNGKNVWKSANRPATTFEAYQMATQRNTDAINKFNHNSDVIKKQYKNISDLLCELLGRANLFPYEKPKFKDESGHILLNSIYQYPWYCFKCFYSSKHVRGFFRTVAWSICLICLGLLFFIARDNAILLKQQNINRYVMRITAIMPRS